MPRPKLSTKKTNIVKVQVADTERPENSVVISRSFWKNFLVGTLLGMFIFCVGVVSIVLYSIHSYFSMFTSAANASQQEVLQTVSRGFQQKPSLVDGRFNVLLLGTDQLENRVGEPILTDTIMLMSLDVETGKLYAISFPRDIWNEKYQTKINGLFEQGRQEKMANPADKTKEVIQELSGVPIQRTVIVSLTTVSQLIDLMGGVEIDVPESFTDDQYPRSDVDIKTVRDPKLLYETVTFAQGRELMSGDRALKYIRSRKSATITQGTDDARSKRQQQVIAALLTTIASPDLVRHPVLLGKLYGFYQINMSPHISMEEVVSLGHTLGSNLKHISMNPQSFSIQSNSNTGVISHPPQDSRRGWVYEIPDKKKFQDEARMKLGYEVQ